MAIASITYQPAAGRQYVVLTSWAGDASFSTTPVASDQIEGPAGLTIGADGSVTGADGNYSLHHIIASTGVTEGVSYQIGTPATPPQGTITFGTATVSQTEITLPFSYSDSDQTGFEYRVNSGSWASTASPITLTGLTANTSYTIEVRAVNSGGSGAVASTSLTTDPIRSVAMATVPFVPGSGRSYTTLAAGFDDYAFQEQPSGEPDVGWQIVTTVGFFDSQGNYWLFPGDDYGVSNIWFITPDGTAYPETLDSTGLLSPLEGEVTIGTATIGRTSATIPFSYSAADAEGFEYRLDGGAWTEVVSPISLSGLTADTEYTVDVRAYNGTTQSVYATITFTTEAAVDTRPDAFSFVEQTNVARSITITFGPITVKGVDAGVDVPISISGNSVVNEYSVSTDGGNTWGGWTSSPTNVRLNYQVRVRHTSSDEYSSGGYNGIRESLLDIGGTVGVARSTTLADTVPPVITLTGGNLEHVQGEPWVEPGYRAIDNADGDISVTGVDVISSLDVNTLGPQQILYRATDRSGNVAEATRIVTVVEYVPDDTVKPVIILTGGNQQLYVGETWTDPGYRAEDDVDGDITDQVQISGTVDTSRPNTTTITYTVSDSSGNIGVASRIVTVLSAVNYPMDIEAPDRRTHLANRFARFDSSEPFFIMQSGEVLDYDFDMSDWLDSQNDNLASGSHEVVELAEALHVEAVGIVTGNQRVKVWLKADTVTDSQSSLVQLKVSTTRSRTAVFQFRVLIINRMQ